mgnify:CR=1 FL=1
MCSIMGYMGSSLSKDKFKEYFDKTISRGPDMQRIEELPGIILGFERLSIMGLDENGMQPFNLNNNRVVCNGEIYGFRALKKELVEKGYTFKSDSDCELLLPLYEEYGTDMFAKLDAEYACIIYDAKTNSLVAARDPIGIRPLFYGYVKDGEIAFASEAKNLVGLCDEIKAFPPGYFYKDGKFVQYRDMTKVTKVVTDDVDSGSAKAKKAKELGSKVITSFEFKKMCEE